MGLDRKRVVDSVSWSLSCLTLDQKYPPCKVPIEDSRTWHGSGVRHR